MSTNHEGLTSEQVASRDKKVAEAILKFKKEWPDLANNEIELARVTSEILTNITKSVLAHTTNNSKDARRARKEHVRAMAAVNNIRFTHYRFYDREAIVSNVEPVGNKGNVIETTEVSVVPSNYGGSTWAWSLELDEDNNLFKVGAVAFCNVNDPFDPLVGEELALQRYLDGLVISEPVQPEKFGPVKREIFEEDYRLELERGFIDDEEPEIDQ